MRPLSAISKIAFRLTFSSQQRLDCKLGYTELIIYDDGLHGYKKFNSIVKIDAKEVVKQRNMGEGWVLRRNMSITRIGAQQLRGFLGVGDGDEDSGLSKTYEVRRVTGTVADNIRYGPGLQGKKLKDQDVVDFLNLADLDASFAAKSGSALSVGQAQRVALARTLANEPEVLLLDEPTSALDPISTQHIEDSIVKLRNVKQMTIVMVSHSVKQIQRIADVVCLLVDGQIVEVLRPDELSSANHPMARRFLELSS